MRSGTILCVLVFVFVLGAGCGNGSSGGHADMETPPDMGRAATDHPPLWRLTHLNNGTAQTAPEVWTVVWPGDEALGAQIADFLDWMLQSDYWMTSMGEYGIGAGTSKGVIVMSTPAPALLGDAQMAGLATMLVANGQITGNSNTQVAFFPPTTTKVTLEGSASCSAFLGYHSHATNTTNAVAYSITARCTGTPGTDLDGITDTLSHETAEAATDAVPGNGIIDSSPAHQEVADLCEFGEDLAIDVPADAMHPSARRYWVQRLYSDMRAAQGTVDPCLPLPTDRPYFNVAFDPEVFIGAPGSAATIDARLDVFAYGDVGPIQWIASSGGADVEPFQGTAMAGDTIPIKVTPGGTLQNGQVIEIDILSESAKAGSQLWFGYIKAGQ
ncbi:MAG TPA: hypothetical protein VGL86_19950 [Polyangia bacterium]|jgi:hypothetical protein